jgi:hypothetical protein
MGWFSRFQGSEVLGSEVLGSGFWVQGSMLTKLIELIELIEFVGLAELIISTNQPFNPINHQSLTFVFCHLTSVI